MDLKAVILADTPASVTDVIVRPVYILETSDPDQVIWPCPRCWDEDGRIAMYAHVANGVCFRCNGRGGEPMSRAAAAVRAKRLIQSRVRTARKNEAERLAKLAIRKAEQDRVLAVQPGLSILLDPRITGGLLAAAPDGRILGDDEELPADWYHEHIRPMGDFVYKIADQFRTKGYLSPKQISAVANAIQQAERRNVERAIEKEMALPAPTGRCSVEGKIIKAVEKEVQAGPYSTQWVTRITVKTADGWVANGNCPSDILQEVNLNRRPEGVEMERALVGQQVRFVATLEASDSPTFAFFKRAAKAEVLDDVQPVDLDA